MTSVGTIGMYKKVSAAPAHAGVYDPLGSSTKEI